MERMPVHLQQVCDLNGGNEDGKNRVIHGIRDILMRIKL